MELEIKKRLNKSVGKQKYYKWYIDIPSEIANNLGLRDGEKVRVLRLES